MSVDNRNIATSDEIHVEIQKVLTKEFYQSLVKHCLIRLHTRFKIKYNFEKGIRGILIEDMIQETLERLLKEGGRNWYKDTFDDIKLQIISSLDSVISKVAQEYIEANYDFIYKDSEKAQLISKSVWFELKNQEKDSDFYEYCIPTKQYQSGSISLTV